MDLAGHQRFTEGRASTRPIGTGDRLLAFAWQGLAAGLADRAAIELRSGVRIEGVLALRIDGPVAEAMTQRERWTHAFAVGEVVMVELEPRGR